jgi:O-antigen/teichoic acid export membrane protein
MIASLGQQNLIVRRFSTAKIDQKRETLAAQISLILGLTFVAALVAWALLWGFTSITNAPDFAVTVWTLPALICWALLIVVAPIHRSIGNFYAGLSVDRVLPRVIFLALLIGLIATLGHAIFDLTIWFSGALFISLGISLWILNTYKIGYDLRLRSHRRLIKPWLSSLGPFFFGASLTALGARYPIFISSYFFAPKELGFVVLLFTFLALISIPTATLNLVVGPNLRRRIAKNPDNTKLRIQYAAAAAALAIVASFAVAIIYPWFVTHESQLPIQALMVFATSLVVAAISNAIMFFQFQAGSRYILNLISLTVLITRIALGLFGLSGWGLIGLGLAEVTSNIILLILLLVFVVRAKP